MDAVDEALAVAKAEHARLTADLEALQHREATALAALHARRDTLSARQVELERGIAEVSARLVPLEVGRSVALSRALKLRKVTNVLLRLVLGTIACSGLMLAITTDWGFFTIFGLAGIQGVSLWTLGDLADKEEMRGG